MFMNYPAELSYGNPLFRSDNYDMKLFVGGYWVQHTISSEVEKTRLLCLQI